MLRVVQCKSGDPEPPPLTAAEGRFAASVEHVWARQMAEALRQVTVGGMSFEWVASESWALEIVELTKGQLGAWIGSGYSAGANQIGVPVAPWLTNPKAAPFIQSHAFKFAERVNRTTRDDFRDMLTESLNAGEAPGELSKRVERLFQGYDQARRADMIARTESLRALNAGTVMGWEETQQVEGKEWDAAGDACPFCLGMHGRVVKMGESFWKEGSRYAITWNNRKASMKMNYGDVDHPPLHPHCRCSLQPVLLDIDAADTGQHPAPVTSTPAPAATPAKPPPAEPEKPRTDWTDLQPVEHATTKEAQAWAQKHNLAEMVDYTGIHVTLANAMNRSLVETLKRFPKVRENLGWVGTNQQRNKRIVNAKMSTMVQRLKDYYPPSSVRVRVASQRANLWSRANGITDRAVFNAKFEEFKRNVTDADMEAWFRDEAKRQAKREGSRTTFTACAHWHKHGVEGFPEGGISVNEKLFKDPAVYMANREYAVDKGTFPAGTKAHRATMDHELGHWIDQTYGVRKSPEFQAWAARQTSKTVTDGLSSYAADQYAAHAHGLWVEVPSEAWAEARTSHAPRAMAKEVADIFEKVRDRNG